MDKQIAVPQWRLLVAVYHGPNFGHYIELEEWTRGRSTTKRTGGGNWRGVGVPEPVLNHARAMIDAKFTEHLVTRYGVQGELPVKWSGEPDPF